MKPANAGRHGQATRKGRRMRYYDNLDNYTDTRPSKLMEFTKRIMPTVIFIGAMALMFLLVGALEVL
jgi:hypothetical protein